MKELLTRLELLELKIDQLQSVNSKLDQLLAAATKNDSEWVDSKEFARLVGLKDTKSLVYYMSKGVLGGDVVRNIGTPKRPRYRFHRIKAMNQFLRRLPQR